jgi:hypothetical protein
MLARSLGNSRRLRDISAACYLHCSGSRPERQERRRCRTCRHLADADTVDVRFVCALGVWSKPTKPKSVGNSRRLRRIGATCPRYAPR